MKRAPSLPNFLPIDVYLALCGVVWWRRNDGSVRVFLIFFPLTFIWYCVAMWRVVCVGIVWWCRDDGSVVRVVMIHIF